MDAGWASRGTCDMERGTYDMERGTYDMERGTYDMERAQKLRRSFLHYKRNRERGSYSVI